MGESTTPRPLQALTEQATAKKTNAASHTHTHTHTCVHAKKHKGSDAKHTRVWNPSDGGPLELGGVRNGFVHWQLGLVKPVMQTHINTWSMGGL